MNTWRTGIAASAQRWRVGKNTPKRERESPGLWTYLLFAGIAVGGSWGYIAWKDRKLRTEIVESRMALARRGLL